MKVLAIDLGNSEIKFALVNNGKIENIERFSLSELDSAAQAIQKHNLPVLISSVRSKEAASIKNSLECNSIEIRHEISWRANRPVSGFYQGLGADRIAALAGAYIHFGKNFPVAVAGFGTATTISSVSASGKFSGGFITLGLTAACQALQEALPELPAIDPLRAGELIPAFDTYAAICKGTVSAQAGTVSQWISILQNELGSDLKVIATGGWSEFLAPYCKGIDLVDPLLTFKGIWEIFKAESDPGGELSGT